MVFVYDPLLIVVTALRLLVELSAVPVNLTFCLAVVSGVSLLGFICLLLLL